MKKLKNRIYYSAMSFLLILICIISVGIFQKSKEHPMEGMIVGNKVENWTYLESLSTCNDTFLNEAMTTSYILKMFEQNASKICDNKMINLSTLLKNKDYIIIQLSMCDFTSKITLNSMEQKLLYDEEILIRQIQTSLSFIHSIMDEIYLLNEYIQVIHVGYYYPFEIFDQTLNDIFMSANERYQQMVEDYRGYYINVYNQSDKNNYLKSAFDRYIKH